MNMNDLQLALPSTSIPDPNAAFTFQNPYPQRFSIPYPIIKYIIQNPQSPKVWKKLIQTCKYFYSKNPVLPVSELLVEYNPDLQRKIDGERFDPSMNLPKLWIHDSFRARTESLFIASLIPKIYKFDLDVLFLSYQQLTLNEYQMLTKSGTIIKLYLFYSTVEICDDKIATFDKLLENLYEIKHFDVTCSNDFSLFQQDTVNKMVQHLMGFKKLTYFRLEDMPESFDIVSFKEFLINNENVNIIFNYTPPVSFAYQEMVTNIVKECKKRRPHIWFS